jgi:hypothetical protein
MKLNARTYAVSDRKLLATAGFYSIEAYAEKYGY